MWAQAPVNDIYDVQFGADALVNKIDTCSSDRNVSTDLVQRCWVYWFNCITCRARFLISIYNVVSMYVDMYAHNMVTVLSVYGRALFSRLESIKCRRWHSDACNNDSVWIMLWCWIDVVSINNWRSHPQRFDLHNELYNIEWCCTLFCIEN